MRLICPNCGAQYMIPDDVIPAEGRDVQCSSCSSTWFQPHADDVAHQEAMAQEDTVTAPDETWAPADPAPEPTAEPEPDPAPEPEPAQDMPAQEAPAPQRQSVDAKMSEIFRQEAEFEANARAQDRLETQPDLGLSQAESNAERRAREARERMARIRNQPEQTTHSPTPPEADHTSRRDLLPDIEEINSTLNSGGERPVDMIADAEARAKTRRKGAFRFGFGLMMILVASLVLLYSYAPAISEAAPQFATMMQAYTDAVDQARIALDGKVRGFLEWLDAKAVAAGGSAN